MHQYVLLFLLSALSSLNCYAVTGKADRALQKAFDDSLYRFKSSGTGGYEGFNPAHTLGVEFEADQARLKHAQGSVSFRLQEYGYGAKQRSPAPASPTSAGNRVEYRRGELTEWYLNDARGVEQGFTLERRPGVSKKGEPLVIALSVEGQLSPTLSSDGSAVLLQSDGVTVLRYDGLHAWDARHREVPSHLEVAGTVVRLIVDDQGAEYPLVVDPQWELETVITPPGFEIWEFGSAVALSGDTAVIGAPYKGTYGSVFVYVRTGGSWSQQAELSVSGLNPRVRFGFSVAVRGNTIIAGARDELLGSTGHDGAAYVFVRNGSTWTQQAVLVPSDGADGVFGWAVSLGENTAVVGACLKTNGSDGSQGAAYVFVRNSGIWTEQQKLIPPGSVLGANFGSAVSLSGDTIAVSAIGIDHGRVYVFARNASVWTQQQELVPPHIGVSVFGASVSVSGDSLAISALNRDYTIQDLRGVAFVFVRNGTNWINQAELTASDGEPNDYFSKVSLSGNTLLVGAEGKGPEVFQGAAYIFLRTNSIWSQITKFTSPYAEAGDHFGRLVSLDGKTALIDAFQTQGPHGAAFLYSLPAGPVITHYFGSSVIPVNGVTSVSFTITNPNPVALTDVEITDSLPPGLVVATPNGVSGSRIGGIHAGEGSGTISLSNAELPSNATCTFSVNVTATLIGSKTNNVTANSINGGPGNTSAASIMILAPAIAAPVITKTFSASSIPIGGIVGLTFKLTNPNSFSLSALGFDDNLPAGLTIATPNGLSGACTGVINALQGTSIISLAGANLAPGDSCSITVNVSAAGATTGRFCDTTSSLTSIEAGSGSPAFACVTVGSSPIVPTGASQVSYASNLNLGDSVVNLTNNGAFGGFDPNGRICVNVYTFDEMEELVSCCACPVTPDGLASLSVRDDLVSNTFTPGQPVAAVIKLLASAPTAGACNPVSPTFGNLVPGLQAWNTKLHSNIFTGGYSMTEGPFSAAVLSDSELSKLTSYCGFIQANGSGFGICRSCRVGGLGGAHQ